MPLTTKNNTLLVKDGKLQTDCGCCGGWACYPTPLYCRVCPSLPSVISATVSLSQIEPFYQTIRTQTVFGDYYRNVKYTPSFASSQFTLTQDSFFRFGFCSYSFNVGSVDIYGTTMPRRTDQSMFSMGIGITAPSIWAGGPSCDEGYYYPFAWHQMSLLIDGVKSATRTQNVPPGSPLFVSPENDEYESQPHTESVRFQLGYDRPSRAVYQGWYAIYGETTSTRGCDIRIELPVSSTLTVPFYYGKHTGTPGFGQVTLLMQAS